MNETRYIISDASKRLDVEPHVLRYWEEELALQIPRNELGHRYYREEDLLALTHVKSLKSHGFSLRAIKMVLPEVDKLDLNDPRNVAKLKSDLIEQNLMEDAEPPAKSKPRPAELSVKTTGALADDSSDKMTQFKNILEGLIAEAMRENNQELSGMVSSSVTEGVAKELDYILRVREENTEERFRHLDETIRDTFKSRQEAAVTTNKKAKRSPLFRKGKKTK